MKLIEIANKIDKSKNNECYIDITEISAELGLSFYQYVDQDRLKAYYLGPWYCTDSWVGSRLYFFDDEFVAYSFQSGRKNNEEFQWVSKKAVNKVKDFILSLMQQEDDCRVSFCDVNEDIGDSYKIGFNTQVLNWSKGRYQGNSFDMIERIKEKPDYGIDKEVRIRLHSTGEEMIVNIKDIDFLYRLKEE